MSRKAKEEEQNRVACGDGDEKERGGGRGSQRGRRERQRPGSGRARGRRQESVRRQTNGVGDEGVAGTGVVLPRANERAEAMRSSTGCSL